MFEKQILKEEQLRLHEINDFLSLSAPSSVPKKIKKIDIRLLPACIQKINPYRLLCISYNNRTAWSYIK